MELKRLATTIFDGKKCFLVIVFNEGGSSLKSTSEPMTEAEFRDFSRDSGLDDAQIDEAVQDARKHRLE